MKAVSKGQVDLGKKIIVCDKCSAEFLVKSVIINECSVEIGGETLLLKYFTCPKCNEIYRVLLVDAQKYQEMVDDLLSVEKRMWRLKGKGNVQLLDQLQKMALRKKARMQNYVNVMNTKYDGTFTFKASENNQKELVYLP